MNDERASELFKVFIDNSVELLKVYSEKETKSTSLYVDIMKTLGELRNLDEVKNLKAQLLLSRLNMYIMCITGNNSEIAYAVNEFSNSLCALADAVTDGQEDEEYNTPEEEMNRSDMLRNLAEKCVADGYTTDEIKDLFNKI